ncbi:MAG: hypothetical protein ACE5HV_18230 [Acidobacteriota bacterium]
MEKGKKRSKKTPAIPPEALDHLGREIDSLGDPDLAVEKSGRYCYVRHGGSPLCRLGYRGALETWDFAIYKYSSQSYSTQEWFPSRGTVADLVGMAMNAYNLR